MISIRKSFYDWLKSSSKISLAVLVILWVLSFVTFVNSLILWDWFRIAMSFSALVLFMLPFFVRQVLRITLPTALEVVYYMFIFAGLILGEVFAFYGPFPFWDVVLHFLSGFVLAGVGLSIVDLLGRGKQTIVFTLLFAFCFSMTLGVVWECLEFTFDVTVRTDAQKDAHVHNISTITMQRDGGSTPVRVDNIEKTEIYLANGEVVTVDEGYLDIGIMDTMKDLFVNAAGATLFVIVGALNATGKQKIAKNFIPIKN